MKLAIVGALLCVAIAPMVAAQKGGYPASPSHGIVGTNPDGTPRYGSEPHKDSGPSQNTVNPSGPAAPDDHGAAPKAEDAGKRSSGNAAPH
jgi:hypothetical protein